MLRIVNNVKIKIRLRNKSSQISSCIYKKKKSLSKTFSDILQLIHQRDAAQPRNFSRFFCYRFFNNNEVY